jgi:hypothetical protein
MSSPIVWMHMGLPAQVWIPSVHVLEVPGTKETPLPPPAPLLPVLLPGAALPLALLLPALLPLDDMLVAPPDPAAEPAGPDSLARGSPSPQPTTITSPARTEM